MQKKSVMVFAVLFIFVASGIIYYFRQRLADVPEPVAQTITPDQNATKTPGPGSKIQPSEMSQSEVSAPAADREGEGEVIATDKSSVYLNYKKFFPEGKVLAEDQSRIDSEGNQVHTQVLEVKLKYPRVKWVQKINRATGEMMSQETYVATHVLLERPENISEKEFLAWIEQANGKVEGRVGDHTYRVGVVWSSDPPSGKDLLQAVDQLKERLEKVSDGKAAVDYDFVRFTR